MKNNGKLDYFHLVWDTSVCCKHVNPTIKIECNVENR